MKKVKVIDKGIYSCSPEIGKKYANTTWAVITSVIGIGLAVLYFISPSVRDGAAGAWVMGLAVCGLLTAVTLLLYYLVGDCKKPLYRPAKSVMNRTERYFDEQNSLKAAEYLMDGNFASIARLPRYHQPLHMLVMYQSEGGEILCAQIVDASGVTPQAMGEIEIFEKGAYELPESLIN